ncbi:MAG: sulfite exporter TauE/SafE family protein [Methanomassiliicoccaceae archaeon]|jgi:uncharacterized membrane protein YfcA|nr:sulfite exporter TauE/SafE family protein [Methanomassiliicoccaceae archaeon]
MDPLMIAGLIVLSFIAGLIGSLFGLGGGIIIVPVLTILYDMDAKAAMAVSLVAIVAISTTSASSLVRDNVSNVRVGLRLEVGSAAGAVIGAVIALHLQSWVLVICFAAVLMYSSFYMFLRPEKVVPPGRERTEDDFFYRDTKTGEDVAYTVNNYATGTLGFVAAGITSAMSGVGGGTIKIPVMNAHMHMPMKAATATSSYVIGITAFSGAAVYFLNGVLDPYIQTAAIVVIGAFAGAMIGLRLLRRINASSMRRYFSVLLLFIASVMLMSAGGII